MNRTSSRTHRRYKIVKARAPTWRFVMHDAFRFTADAWGGFMAGCPDIALDTHVYQAWADPGPRLKFYVDACQAKNKIALLERSFGPVVVGEWSLATDNCAMWLNGLNDNLPGFPKLPCKFIPCAEPYARPRQNLHGISTSWPRRRRDPSLWIPTSPPPRYMGSHQPGAPPDKSKPYRGPFGTGVSGPIYGYCPVDRDWPSPVLDSDGDGIIDRLDLLKNGDPISTGNLGGDPAFDDTDAVMRELAAKKLLAFGQVAHGFFFWNFRTELEPHWSWLDAHERGWLPDARGDLADACKAEDSGSQTFNCVARPGLPDKTYRDGMAC